MTIKLTNTATRKKEDFAPLDRNDVRMYVCGPTVYDRAHLGNARPVLVFDVLYRLLRHTYGPDHVTYVRNFTDVDDKINARAADTGRPIGDITDETIAWYHEDMDALGALRPTHEPRATEYIPQMIAMIEELIAKGVAYEAEGHVLFAVDKYEPYGQLSGRSIDDMIAGARVEVAPYKRNPMDFVLWKPSDEDLPGWDSPWGRGRPGWHIECSAMARDLLGERFDIHGGGIDLQFPHHENEIAQSKCACGEDSFAQVWMHNEMLQVEGKKMSKSLGNFFTVRDLLDQGVPGEVIRFVMLSTHYSKPMDWTNEKAIDAEYKMSRYRSLILEGGIKPEQLREPPDIDEVTNALCDDLNTPEALQAIDRYADSAQNSDMHRSMLLEALKLLGLFPDLTRNVRVLKQGISLLSRQLDEISASGLNPIDLLEADVSSGEKYLWGLYSIYDYISELKSKNIGSNSRKFLEIVRKYADGAMLASEIDRAETLIGISRINALIERRAEAKKYKDYSLADRIRSEISELGLEVKDTPQGTKWRLSK